MQALDLPAGPTPLTVHDSYRYCERLARREAGNFYLAFRFLPKPQRLAMCALYAFLRITDDISDEEGSVAAKRAALAVWRRRFNEALQGRYTHRLHAAFHDTVTSYRIPRAYLEAVLDGVEMDLEPTCYATFPDLYRYCYRVASAVGLACIHIWGFADQRALAYAESAGIAFQLTNILRDLAEDARRQRIYLPLDDLRRFGYAAEKLRAGERDETFHELMRFEVDRARRFYDASFPLVDLLPRPGRSVFQVMSGIYRGLLDEIERRVYDVFSERVRLSAWKKLGIACGALPTRFGWG